MSSLWFVWAGASSKANYRKLDTRLLSREGALAVGYESSVQWNARRGLLARLCIYACEDQLHFRYGVDMQTNGSVWYATGVCQ